VHLQGVIQGCRRVQEFFETWGFISALVGTTESLRHLAATLLGEKQRGDHLRDEFSQPEAGYRMIFNPPDSIHRMSRML
jgi:hypothetical protein